MVEGSKLNYPGLAPFGMDIKYVDIFPDDPTNDYDDHIHEECEIYVNLTGDVSFMVENRIYPVRSGSVIITRPYEYHHCIYHSNERHKHFWILFTSSGNEGLLGLFFERMLGEKNLIELSEKQKEEVCALCFEMIRKERTAFASLADFFRLISMLENAGGFSEIPDTMPADIGRAISFIGDNLHSSFTVSDAARAAHISVNTLERRFLEVLQTTPSAYIKKRRLARAAELLPGAESVGEVADKCGFCDYSNFICLFRKQFGITPLKYKKLHSTKNKDSTENEK